MRSKQFLRSIGASLTVMFIGCALVILGWRELNAPRVWAASETPIAFWAWRNEAPSDVDWHAAHVATNANVLFLRAAQFDLTQNQIKSIRHIEGATLTTRVDVHLVYNLTPSLLESFAGIDENVFTDVIFATYAADCARLKSRPPHIIGLQLDFDVPSSKLHRYAELLQVLRLKLKTDSSFAAHQLSITGLPTWMHTAELAKVLINTDFWIPQFYGDTIPPKIGDVQAIAAPDEVVRGVEAARALRHPFYAGLAAYNHVTLYSTSGELIALRGDIAPHLVAHHPALRLLETHRFTDANDAPALITGTRYVYQAQAAARLADLHFKPGERLVVNSPTAAGLRFAARRVRQSGGENLRGICLFRLPTQTDATTLSLAEIALALADKDAPEVTAAQLFKLAPPPDASRTPAEVVTDWQLLITNDGATRSLFGDAAMLLNIYIPRGGLVNFYHDNRHAVIEPRCRTAQGGVSVPCGARRADIVQIKTRTWQMHDTVRLRLSLRGEFEQLPFDYRLTLDDGRIIQRQARVTNENYKPHARFSPATLVSPER